MADGNRPNPLFRVLILLASVFVITVLSLVACMFGDPRAPVSRFLDANGEQIILWEVLAIGLVGLAAMTFDRIGTLRHLARQRRQALAARIDQPATAVSADADTPPVEFGGQDES